MSTTEKHRLMMTQGSPVTVILTSVRGKVSTGVVRWQGWDKKARGRRALRIFGLLWGIALVSVLAPIAHFFLVPAFLLAGPVVAGIVYGQESAILGGESRCPECDAHFVIARRADRWPLRDLCSACQSEVTIDQVQVPGVVG